MPVGWCLNGRREGPHRFNVVFDGGKSGRLEANERGQELGIFCYLKEKCHRLSILSVLRSEDRHRPF
jgi:hypothetical protein